MAQTSNAIDRRFSTPYYTNTNYSYIKSKPNGAFSAASCFGRSGCWGRGGRGGERPNGVVRERLLIWQSLPKTGNYSSFVFRRSRVGRGVWSPVRILKLTDELTRNEFRVMKEEIARRREILHPRRHDATQHCRFSIKIGRQKYLWICFVLKDRNRKREEAEYQNMQEFGSESFFS